jgi:Uma2 family endonuclease
MSAVAPVSGTFTPVLPLRIYRFSLEQYSRMIAEGILDADAVEFVDGLILDKATSQSGPPVLVAASSNGAASASPPLPVHRFTVDQYHTMIQTEILGEEDPVELLEGWVITKMSRGPRHDAVLALALRVVGANLPANWHLRGQSAVTTEQSEPEPDVAVVRGDIRDYMNRHPGPGDTALGIEVADSSLSHDRNFKGPIYAKSGLPVYWVINLRDAQIEIYSDPSVNDPQPRYRQCQIYRKGDSVPLVLDGQVVAMIPVRDLLP